MGVVVLCWPSTMLRAPNAKIAFKATIAAPARVGGRHRAQPRPRLYGRRRPRPRPLAASRYVIRPRCALALGCWGLLATAPPQRGALARYAGCVLASPIVSQQQQRAGGGGARAARLASAAAAHRIAASYRTVA
jgi:hypothetical protein